MQTFYEFDFTAKMLCIGERIKKGTYRPCVLTIPCSTISGALVDYTGLDDIVAVGYFDNVHQNIKKLAVFAPQDSVSRNSKLPLTVEYLENIQGKVFILQNQTIKTSETILENLPKENDQSSTIRTFTMGALKSKGFGSCTLEFVKELKENDFEVVEGKLKSRIYADEKYLGFFGISINQIIKPVYGYLFRPMSVDDGCYHLSLFEDSIVKGFSFLVEEV